MARNTLSRTLHDVGLSAWFGGTLANAVALNAAAGEAGSDAATGRVANAGWDRWTPVNAAAIGAHLVGSVGQLRATSSGSPPSRASPACRRSRPWSTAAALGATAYSRVLGARVSAAGAVPAKRGTRPSRRTKVVQPDVAAAQQQLDTLQWVIPALTGVLVAISSYAGEQQRPGEVARGLDEKA